MRKLFVVFICILLAAMFMLPTAFAATGYTSTVEIYSSDGKTLLYTYKATGEEISPSFTMYVNSDGCTFIDSSGNTEEWIYDGEFLGIAAIPGESVRHVIGSRLQIEPNMRDMTYYFYLASEAEPENATSLWGWLQRLWDTLSEILTRLRHLFDITSIGIDAVNALRLVIVQVIAAVMIMPTELQTFAMFSVLLMVAFAIIKIFC